jgi:lambda family phage minor tail protein L
MILNDIQQADLGILLTFYELDLSMIAAGTTPTYWVQATQESESGSFCVYQPIVWRSITWNPIDLQVDQWSTSSKGALPRPKITLANVLGLLTPSIQEYGDMVGGKIIRYRTFSKYLDGQPGADPTAQFPPDTWIVNKKIMQNKLMVQFELACWIDQQVLFLPARQVLRDYCLWRYRQWNTATGSFSYSNVQCPYTGAFYYDEYGNGTTAPNDQCGRRKSDCQLRFPGSQALPSGAYFGVLRTDTSGGTG